MADYENTVGIQLNSDFTKAIANARILASALRNMKNDVSALSSSVKQLKKSFDLLNNFKFTALTTQLNGLQELARMIRTLDVSGITGKANELKAALEALKGIDVSAITKLREIPKAMKSIASLDSSKVGKVFSTLATQIQPFIAKLKEASDEIKALANVTDEIKKFHKEMEKAKIKTEELGQKANKTGSKLKSMFTVGNMIYLFNMSKRFFDFINNSIQSAIDFREVENKFSAAMGNMRQEAIKFSNQVNESFGLALQDVMEAQSTFKNMLSAIKGLTGETSTWLSNVLMEMSVDFSSLYNTSIESAITKMQAALSRQVRPIRSVSGMDITQNVLGASLQQLGIYDRTVSQLSEMEKRLLIIYTLQQQMGNSGALGDYALTIESTANQLRILKQQIKEVGQWLGAVFENTLGRILPYINAFTMVIKELIKAFAILIGYEMPNSDRTNIFDMMDDTAEDFGITLGSGIDKAAKKVKNLLAPFDKVNVIAKPEESSSSSGDAGGLGGIDPRILDALKQYESSLEGVRMKATQIRDRIMEWLGFTKIVDEETGEITWKLKDGYTNLEKIRDIIIAIGTALVGAKIYSTLQGIGAKLLEISGAATFKELLAGLTAVDVKVLATKGIITAVIVAIIGALVDLWKNNDEWRKNVIKAWENVKDVLKSIYNNVLTPIFNGIKQLFRTVYEFGIKPLWNAWVEFVGEVTGIMLDLWNFLSPLLTQLLNLLGPIFTGVLEYLGTVIGLVFAGALSIITNFVKFSTEKIKAIRSSLSQVTDFLKNVFAGNWQSAFNNLSNIISGWFTQKIKPFFTIKKWKDLGSGVKEGLTTAFKNAVNAAIGLFNRFISSINSKMKLTWKDFKILGQTIISAGSFTLFQIPKIPSFWNGGIVPRNIGQLFIANEPGNPELVGNIGGHTSVVNNNMIIEAIKGAMKSAIIEGMQLVFQEMPNGDMYVDIYIDGVFTERKLIDENEKKLLKTGKPVFFSK